MGGIVVEKQRCFELTRKAMDIIGAEDAVCVQTFKRTTDGEFVIHEQRYYRESNPEEQIVYRYEYATDDAVRLLKRHARYKLGAYEEAFEEVLEWPSTM